MVPMQQIAMQKVTQYCYYFTVSDSETLHLTSQHFTSGYNRRIVHTTQVPTVMFSVSVARQLFDETQVLCYQDGEPSPPLSSRGVGISITRIGTNLETIITFSNRTVPAMYQCMFEVPTVHRALLSPAYRLDVGQNIVTAAIRQCKQ
jgi:hypothetical protein